MIARLPGRAVPLRRDERGATIIEFAMILFPFMVLIVGTLDLGYHAYLRAMATGALERAARRAAVGNKTSAQIVTMIQTEMRTILPQSVRNNADAVVVTPLSYYNFSAVGGGERITGDTAPVGSYNSTDCYEDRNNNGHYDATGGGGADLGGADDIVYYDVKVTAPRLFPFAAIMGWSSDVTVDAKTLIRNQPYGDQQVRIRCS